MIMSPLHGSKLVAIAAIALMAVMSTEAFDLSAKPFSSATSPSSSSVPSPCRQRQPQWTTTATQLHVSTSAQFMGHDGGRQRMGDHMNNNNNNNNNNENHRKAYRVQEEGANSYRSAWLDEFRTGSGEVIDPYIILKVPRNAERTQIRSSYLKLSRKFHPDSVRHKDILPGRCNNLEDVRDEWERVSLSYRILSDRKTRKRYDRHEAIADPAQAVRRATFNAIGGSIVGIGKGIFDVGAFAVKSVAHAAQNKS